MGGAPKSTNITWHDGEVARSDRERLLGHKPALIWLTGLSGSGKSTIARAVESALLQQGIHAYVLDGDNVRFGLNADLGFSPADRTENIRRVGEVAKLFVDSGAVVLTAFISPYQADRERVRAAQARTDDFIEVFVDCPLDVCESRDPKGLYKRARAGEIPGFTGISAPYEAPESAELVLDTEAQSVAESAEAVVRYLIERGIVAG